MKTPICDFVRSVGAGDTARFFMPGHKGRALGDGDGFAAAYPYDITEIDGADVLYSADGIILESEKNAAALFGSEDTLYSAGGSTLCIQAMTALAARRGSKIIAGRNAHMAFINACILLRLEPVWILPRQADAYGVCGLIDADQVEQMLTGHPDAAAVYLTSPDYLGNTADLRAISAVCRRYHVPLICDNAHGAYLKFTGGGGHPMDCGADLCCDSAHKTLPVLTGGAYLHLGKGCGWSREQALEVMGLFGSSSPSYLVLQSLDRCNNYLDRYALADYRQLEDWIESLKERLRQRGIGFLPNTIDFAKLTLDAGSIGMTGEELACFFRSYGAEPEYSNESYLVCMLSPNNSEKELALLSRVLDEITVKPAREPVLCGYCLPERVMLPWKAYGSRFTELPVSQAVGRISARTVASCPPGVPVIMPGEIITNEIKNICESSRNFTLKVVE